MSRTAAPAKTVREEIWVSLVSMLQAYASAANLHRPSEAARFEVSVREGSARIGCGGHRLEIALGPESGAAHWALDPPGADGQRGSFLIEENGELLFEGQGSEVQGLESQGFAGQGFAGRVKELDQAAMDWLALLSAAGQRPRPADSPAPEKVEKACREGMMSGAK